MDIVVVGGDIYVVDEHCCCGWVTLMLLMDIVVDGDIDVVDGHCCWW